MKRTALVILSFALLLWAWSPGVVGAQSFANWETPQVHPMDLTSGGLLLVVNTADGRLEVFDVSGALPPPLVDSIPVGLDPVSVRANGPDEAWVVNQISDSVSIVDLTTGNVRLSLRTADEPADVVFAGTPALAFVSCSQANLVQVFDPANLDLAPVEIPIDGEDPRAMAVSADGSQVYVAIFDSGNGSTVLGGGTPAGPPPQIVSLPSSATPYGGTNPPPNAGLLFEPTIDPDYLPGGLTPAPRVSLIVKEDPAGRWMDDNGGDWSQWVSGANADLSGRPVGWTLLDNDVAIIDTATRAVTYATRLMNAVMAIAVHPTTGDVTVVGTDATNEVRFEPNLRGVFLRVGVGRVSPTAPTAGSVRDLNDHLTYTQAAVDTATQAQRDCSIGDPRAIVWRSAGNRGYVAGMGSSNVVAIDSLGNRVTTCSAAATDTISVGPGPTGLALDEARNRLYVLNRFSASVSAVDLTSELEIGRFGFFDPTPGEIRIGRRHLYDTHETSGLGQISCASCHPDGRMDHLAWDLGDPAGDIKVVTDVTLGGQHNLGMNVPDPGFTGGIDDFHPMKGPMVTQTLQDIIGKEPFHWRGDKDGLEEFNGAFKTLNGDDEQLSGLEMQELEDFLATLRFPPNPFRNPDNTLPTDVALPGQVSTGRFFPVGLARGAPLANGNAVTGRDLYVNGLAGVTGACTRCHTLPTGTSADLTFVGGAFTALPPGSLGERHLFLLGPGRTPETTVKPAQLRNLYERTGFDVIQNVSRSGFGFTHDGSVDSMSTFLYEVITNTQSDQEVSDLMAFLLAFSGSGPDLPTGSLDPADDHPLGPTSLDTHAGVGLQLTVHAGNRLDPSVVNQLIFLQGLADVGEIGLVAKGRQLALQRGWEYVGGGVLQSDRKLETTTLNALRLAAGLGSEVTFTAVVEGTQRRIGIDRDLDACPDRDELDAGFDPADPASTPAGC